MSIKWTDNIMWCSHKRNIEVKISNYSFIPTTPLKSLTGSNDLPRSTLYVTYVTCSVTFLCSCEYSDECKLVANHLINREENRLKILYFQYSRIIYF